MVDLSITIYTCCASFFMFINKNLKETAFNYCTQWSGVDDQKIDRSINSIGAMSHIIYWLPLEGMASTKRNAHPLKLRIFDFNYF